MTVFDNFFQSFQLKMHKQKINECIQLQTVHHFLDTRLRVLNSVIGHTVLEDTLEKKICPPDSFTCA